MPWLVLKPQLTLLLKSLTALNLVAREAAHDFLTLLYPTTSPVGLNMSASILVHFQIIKLNTSACIIIIAWYID